MIRHYVLQTMGNVDIEALARARVRIQQIVEEEILATRQARRLQTRKGLARWQDVGTGAAPSTGLTSDGAPAPHGLMGPSKPTPPVPARPASSSTVGTTPDAAPAETMSSDSGSTAPAAPAAPRRGRPRRPKGPTVAAHTNPTDRDDAVNEDEGWSADYDLPE